MRQNCGQFLPCRSNGPASRCPWTCRRRPCRRGRTLCRAVRVKGATARPNLRPRCASSRRGLAGLSIGAHALELLRNQRSLGGSPGARPDGVWVSMVLTSTPHRCCTPKKDRRISTIPAGCFDGRLGSVGAVDTGPRRSESPWVLPQSPAPFSQVLLHRSRARSLRRVPVVIVRSGPAQNWLEITRVGLLHEGRDPLAKGCAYCTKAQPTRSTPNSRPVAPHPRAVHPGDAGSHRTDRVSPSGRLKQQLSRPAGAPTPSLPPRSYLMPRGRGLRVLCCLLTSETCECHDF